MPIKEYEPDPNRLVWSPEAKGLWKVIISDLPLPRKYKEEVISADAPPGSTPSGSPAGSGAPSDASPSARRRPGAGDAQEADANGLGA